MIENYKLNSVSDLINQDERYTDWYDPNNDCKEQKSDFSMIDHILVTEKIKKYISQVFIYHGYAEFCGKYNSDHYPVVVDLSL